MYIRAGSDAIRRQIMASHHGRGNRLMKNVRPVETFPIIKWNAKKIVPAIIRFPLSIASSFLSSFSFFFFFSRFRCLHNGPASRPQVRRSTKFCWLPVRSRQENRVRLLPGITAFSAEDTHRTELIRQRVRDTYPVLFVARVYAITWACNENYRMSYLRRIEIDRTVRKRFKTREITRFEVKEFTPKMFSSSTRVYVTELLYSVANNRLKRIEVDNER